jgi:hypothetical protein
VKIFDGTTFALQRTVQLAEDADNMRYDARHQHVLVDYGGEKFLYGKVQGRQGEKDGAVAVLDLDGNKLGQIPTSGLQRRSNPKRRETGSSSILRTIIMSWSPTLTPTRC